MKILVTGGTGFVGAPVVRLLVQKGHHVRVLLRESSPKLLLTDLHYEEFIGDITDPVSVYEAMKDCNVVFHVAGHVSHWSGDKKLLHQINVLGTKNVVDACVARKIDRLIHTSSIAAIGKVKEGTVGDETLKYDWPEDVCYNQSKHLAEKEVYHGIDQGLDAVIVNPAVVFGAGEIDANAGGVIIKSSQGKIPFYLGGGNCVCDVEDVANGHLLAWKKGKTGERYILGGENLSWKEVMHMVADVVESKAPSFQIPTWLLTCIIYAVDSFSMITRKKPPLTKDFINYLGTHYYFSSDKASRELGYTVTPFRETIKKSYEWFKENKYL